MGWVALDDGFFANPKILEVGHAGAGLYAMALSYCGKYLTDGFVPAGWLNGHPKALASKLTTAKLWAEVEGGFQIEDYADHNPTKQQVEERKAHASHAAQTRWRKPQVDARGNAARIARRTAKGNAESEAPAIRKAMPSPPLTSHRDSAVRSVSKGSRAELPESHRRELVKILECVSDADGDTPDVFAAYASQLSVGSVAKVRESVELRGEPVGSGYVVRALQSEIAERATHQTEVA